MREIIALLIIRIIDDSESVSIFRSSDEIFEEMTEEHSKGFIDSIGFTDMVYSGMCSDPQFLSKERMVNSETITSPAEETPL